MNSPHFSRALLLRSQGRNEQAAEEFRQHLLEFPDDPAAHVNLSLVLTDLRKFDEATRHAGEAISLVPDEAAAHYALAYALSKSNQPAAARKAIDESLRLDPEDPDAYALRAAMAFDRKSWQSALDDANAGLEFDPEHNICLNLRAQALVMLSQRGAAAETLDKALERNPEDPLTQANTGWALLERGQPKQAMEHFREALRLEPDNDWARRGIVEAMKARSLIYRVFLKWLFLMMKLPMQVQLALVVGGLVGIGMIDQLGNAWPAARPVVSLVVYAYLAFAVLTWVADLVFDLLLQLNRFGRLALSTEQRRRSLIFGGWCSLALAAGIWSYSSPIEVVRLFGVTRSILSIIVCAAILKTPFGRVWWGVLAAGVAWAGICIYVVLSISVVNGVPMITDRAEELRGWITPLFLAIQFLPGLARSRG